MLIDPVASTQALVRLDNADPPGGKAAGGSAAVEATGSARRGSAPGQEPLGRERRGLAGRLRAWLAEDRPVARVLIEQALGSTPRETGVSMLVRADEVAGTIGGGRLEWDAVAAARALLAEGGGARRLDIPLGPAIGQCCGGRVALLVERADARVLEELVAAEGTPRPVVLLFGAGHVGRALARALAPLPLQVRWIDARAEAFDRSLAADVEIVETEVWTPIVAEAPPGAACIVMTHSHALDSLVTAAALERGTFAYVGLIGSATKRRRFEHAFRDIGIPEDRISTLVCPLGGGRVRDKRPEVIAALTAAEVLEALLREP